MFTIVLLLVSCGSGDLGSKGATTPRFAYVANNSDNTISMYTVNAATGQLRHNGYVAAGATPSSVTVGHSGKFAYVANEFSNDVSAYTIDASTGALTQVICSTSCNGNNFLAGTGPVSVSVDPSGKFAYVANSISSDVSAYTINATTGALTQINCIGGCNGNNFLAGIGPFSVTVDPLGRFAYVANITSSDVSAYIIDATTGALIQVLCGGGPGCSNNNFLAGSAPRSVTVDPLGRFAYVANIISSDISAYSINPANGALTRIICIGVCSPAFPVFNFPAGASPYAVTVDPSGNFAYVANAASNDVSAYAIDAAYGALTRIPCVSGGCNGYNFKAGTSPFSVTVDASGKFAYAANLGSNDVSVYGINVITGSLTSMDTVRARSGSISIAMTGGAAAVTYTPKFAYVANQNSDNVSAYTINATTGTLTAVAGSPFTTGTGPYSVTVVPSGKFAYVANQNSDSVSAYTIDATTGVLAAVSGSPITTGAGTSPISVAVDSSSKFVYMANYGSANVSAYTINVMTGALATVTGSPFTAGTLPHSVTTDPTGQFAYAANYGSNDVSAYTINPVSGVLTQIPCGGIAYCNGSNYIAGTNPISVTIDPTGKFVYMANYGSANVSAYSINSLNGALIAVPGSPFMVANNPRSVTVDPSGKFAYVANNSSTNVSILAINATTGALSSTGTAAAGNMPTSVAVDSSGKFAYVTNGSDSNVLTYTLDAATGALTRAGTSVATGTLPQTITTTGTIQ